MLELRRIVIAKEASAVPLLQAWSKSMEVHGYQVETSYLGQRFLDLLVPMTDRAWRSRLRKAVESGAVEADWMEDSIIQRYSAEEVRAAPLFQPIHAGRSIEFPQGRDRKAGVCQLVSVDESAACGGCGAGVRQEGEIRVPAAEIDKCGSMASIWLGPNVFWMLADRVVKALEAVCGEPIPRREVVTTGKATARERWWQLLPESSVLEGGIKEHRSARRVCSQCGAVWLSVVDGPPGRHFTARQAAWCEKVVPPVVRSPFWEGELTRFDDGRVKHFPERALWFRGDVARHLAAEKIRGLDLHPIIWF
jgi:hypothetical protein